MNSRWKIQSLCNIRTGEIVSINSIHTDMNTKRKLINLGIEQGEEISVISGEINTAYLIEVSGAQIMIDWDTVKQIRVKTGVL